MTDCNAEKSQIKIQVLISILDFCSKLAIVLVAIRWVTIDLPGQQKESENKAWQSIIASKKFIQEEEKNNVELRKDNKSYINNYGIKNALESLTEVCKYGEGLDFAIPWKDDFIASTLEGMKYALGKRTSCVYLSYIKLDSLNLAYIQLEGARLANVSFEDANLFQANLKNADLQNAVLTNANLKNANLAGTNLAGANYDVTKMQKPSVFLCKTVMYDGTISYPDDECKQKFEDWKKSLKSKK
ncbi:pentapeptide repeat-containing protein [Nostoc sp. PCC 9305]|uniref:pentapeptide repeat-containing protein n=1 Tax=Nostoc sp. PCC 9305 TaxID=296636 RepID=UPI0039C731F6